MLTENFLAATVTPDKPSNTAALGIHIHELQPLKALRSTFKKSSSNPNCVAVSRTHIFGAQAEKAVVHVYSRGRSNQEAIVPFPERIHAVALAGERDGAGILALGTEKGRLILWELGTGRQVSTPQHHLQPITCLAVDLTSNFLLSGSLDSSIHVWSLPGLLSFSVASWSGRDQDIPYSPLRSLSGHRTAITALAFGHGGSSSSNIAVSTSKDGTCFVWNFASGTVLHTYLLPNGPLCLALDPADRAVYVGHEDGSIQLVDFFKQLNPTNSMYDSELRNIPSQPPEKDRWPPPPEGDPSAVIALDISYDGTLLISGHRNGKIHTWDIATGRLMKEVVDLAAPVTSLIVLPPTGFPHEPKPSVTIHNVVKPHYESFANGGIPHEAAVPQSYSFTAQFLSSIPISGASAQSSFHDALTHASFPQSLLEEAVAEFGAMRDMNSENADSTASEDLRDKNSALSAQLEVALAQHRSAESAIKERDQADWKRRQDEEIKAAKKKRRRLLRIKADEVVRKKEMKEPLDHVDEGLPSEEEDLSSSTDEE